MHKRKNKLILKEFESHFILITMTTVVTVLMLASSVIAIILWSVNPIFMDKTALWESIGLSILGLGMMAFVYFFLMHVSHKIAGPIFVLLKCLDELGKGNLKVTMNLRKDDKLHDVAETFNANTEKLKSRVSSIKNTVQSLQNHASSANEETKKLIERLNSELADFDTSD